MPSPLLSIRLTARVDHRIPERQTLEQRSLGDLSGLSQSLRIPADQQLDHPTGQWTVMAAIDLDVAFEVVPEIVKVGPRRGL